MRRIKLLCVTAFIAVVLFMAKGAAAAESLHIFVNNAKPGTTTTATVAIAGIAPATPIGSFSVQLSFATGSTLALPSTGWFTRGAYFPQSPFGPYPTVELNYYVDATSRTRVFIDGFNPTGAATTSVIGTITFNVNAAALAGDTQVLSLTGHYFAGGVVKTFFPASAIFTVGTGTNTVPGAPTIGTATAGNGQATVGFTVPVTDGGSSITSYTATSNPGGKTGTGILSPIIVPGLTNGTAYSFKVTATNAVGTGPASAASNIVTPVAVNTAPSFVKGADKTVVEDAGAQTFAGWATAISAGTPGESGQILTFTATNNNNALFSAQPAVSSTGTLTFTPVANVSGSATVTLSLKDNGGTANGGVDTSAPQTFAITVNPVNDAPSFTKGADQTVAGNSGAQTVAGWATNMSAGPADESSQTLTFTTINNNSALFSAQPVVATNGTLTFTPVTNASGSAAVMVAIKDNGGTANGGVDTSLVQTLTITVMEVKRFILPDSDQRTCYQHVNPYAEILCEGTGQDGAYLQNSLNYTNNGIDTVTDNNTGLIWQKQGDGVPYNWYRASGTFDEVDNPEKADICGSLALGTKSDWRLPTEKELMSIVDYQIAYPGPTVRTDFFPNLQKSQYWTSATLVTNPGEAWYVSFMSGSVDYGGFDKSSKLNVLCVRDSQTFDGALSDNGNGTVSDTRNGFVWQQGESEAMSWGAALSYCEGKDFVGHTDWRLPNIKELESLVDATKSNPAIDATKFPTAHVSYWSSTTPSALNAHYQAWLVDFTVGQVISWDKNDVQFEAHARCVRGGNVISVNHAPSFVKGEDQAVAEDAGGKTVVGWASAISPGPASESGQTLTFTATNNNNALFGAQPAVASSGTLTYTPKANASGNATVTLTLKDNGGTANGGVDTSAAQTFTIAITSVNDPPTLAVIAPLTINENAGLQTVNLSGIAAGGGESQTLTVTATSSNTGLIPNPAVTYTSPNATGSIAFTPVANVSGTATITVTVNDGQAANNTSSRQFVVTVQQLTRTVQFSVPASSGSEATTPAPITVSLSLPFDKTAAVNFATANGTAVAGSDYTATSGTLTFNPGVTTQTINVPVTNDTAVELNETLTVTLTGPTNATLGVNTVHTYTINDNDSPTVQFSRAASSGLESSSPATITVSMSAASGRAVTVSYATANGTAIVGSDYTATSGTLTFQAGVTNRTITVPITNDTNQELDETFTVRLTNPVNATLGASATHTRSIYDDGVPGVAGLKAIAEGVDQPAWTFTTTVSANWWLQTAVRHDGTDAARSGFIADNTASSFQTTGSFGAGTVSFWWKVSSESGSDLLRFSIDGTVKDTISGEVDWQQKSYPVTAGSHTLKWEYSKDGAGSDGVDAAWVDQLVLPSALLLWTRSDTGEANLWSGNSRSLPGAMDVTCQASLIAPFDAAGPWAAMSCVHADASADYVLWSRGDTGQAVLAKVIPGARPGSSASDWAYLGTPAGEGGPWQATSYTHVDAATGYVLWSRGDTGQAILWKVAPGEVSGTIPVTSWAYLDAPTGVGGPWKATSYTHVDTSTGYVLWTRSDTGQAILWKVAPGEVSGTIPVTSWAYLDTPSGLGELWQATSYSHINTTEGYVLWARSDTRQAILWKVVPGEVSGTIPVTSWEDVSLAKGVGGTWRATSYVHGATPASPGTK